MKKTTISLLIMTLLLTLALTYFPSTATADPETIVWLTHWTEPEEVAYWSNVTAAYKKLTGVTVERHAVEFDALYETLIMRHAAGECPDIIHMHAMWIPALANWVSAILAIPPAPVQADVIASWTPATVEGVTFKDIIWGPPSEFNSWALAFNHKVINDTIATLSGDDKTFLIGVRDKLMAGLPLTWTLNPATSEFTRAAILLTKGAPPTIDQTGFCPFVEGMPEEQRFQFLSMLWSNGGEYLDLAEPTALFDGPEGKEVMQLYSDLGYVYETYDPMNMTDYWWTAWADENLAMQILPTWMTYVRDAMPGYFDHVGVAPIPIGPSGTESKSVTYNWLNAVTHRAVDEGRDAAAWAFLNWLNEPKPEGYLRSNHPNPNQQISFSLGVIPRGNDVSIMGDFLIYDSIVPSRTTDLANGRVWEEPTPPDPYTSVGDPLAADHWFSSFITYGSPPYGRADEAFLKSEEAQYEIGVMFESVTTVEADPIAAVDAAAAAINDILPMAGDVNIDGPVNIRDAVLVIKDWGATSVSPKWNRGRSDIKEDGVVDIFDAVILSVNYGKVGDP